MKNLVQSVQSGVAPATPVAVGQAKAVLLNERQSVRNAVEEFRAQMVQARQLLQQAQQRALESTHQAQIAEAEKIRRYIESFRGKPRMLARRKGPR